MTGGGELGHRRLGEEPGERPGEGGRQKEEAEVGREPLSLRSWP